MPQFTFEGPDGQRHTIEGPEGAKPEEAFKILQQHLGQPQGGPNSTPGSLRSTPGLLKSAASGLIQGAGAPGDLSNSVLGNAPPQQPIDKGTYYGKLVDALNVARKHLEMPTTQNVGNAVGMQPTQPVTGAEKAVQGAASMIPGMALGGAPTGRAMMGAAPAANAVRQMGLAPQNAPTPQGFGAQMAQNVGRAPPPGPPPASAIGANPGAAAQQGFLKQAAKEAISMGGHAMGGPLGGLAARFAPKVLGLE